MKNEYFFRISNAINYKSEIELRLINSKYTKEEKRRMVPYTDTESLMQVQLQFPFRDGTVLTQSSS